MPFHHLFFMRIVVRAVFVRAAFGDGLGAFHHEGAAHGTNGSGGFCFDGVFACRVVGAAVEDPESAAPFNHFALHLALLACGARDAGFFSARIAVLVFFNVFAFGIAGARDEFAESSFALHEFSLKALGA